MSRETSPPRAVAARSRCRAAPFLALLSVTLLLALPAIAKKDKRIEELAESYRQWLGAVELLLSEEEREAFLELEKDYQRDAFIERFWRIRDPYPDTTRNEFKERWERLLSEAQELFGGLHEDRSRMLLLNGFPDARLEFRCSTHVWPLEIWFYDGSDRVPYEFFLVFVQRFGGKRFWLWRPRDGIEEIVDKFGSSSGGLGFWQQLQACKDGDLVVRVLRSLLADPFDFELLEARINQPAESPSPEWLATFDAYSTDLPPDARLFSAELDIEYPGRYQSRTVVLGTLRVPRQEVERTVLAGEASYNLLLSGEVLREGKLFESFRYKFDLPAEGADGALVPMTFERRLRPGAYTLVLKLEDLASGSFFRTEQEIDVPLLERGVPAPPADSESSDILAAAAATLEVDTTTLELVPPRGDMHSGMVRFDTLTTGQNIAEVVFSMNGTPVLRKRRPPWSVELDLGQIPRAHELSAVALDAEGKEVASDDLVINGGVHRFRVRLVEPHSDTRYGDRVRATADVAVPEDAAVERVEFYLDENLVATLYQPPFTQEITLPGPGAMAYVRAVAYQPDGNATEDLVFINAPGNLEEVEVEFVELFTTVLDKQNRPVLDLAEEDFTAYEDGVEQEIVRFEVVRDLPVHAGIVLDISASMEPSIDAAKQAALRFFEETITPKDRSALVTFNDHPQLAMKFSNDARDLAAGLAGIKAERGTALYDSLIFTLYYFNGIKGQRVLLLLSDGKDENSRFSFEDALEYARRTGVAIYAIGLDISGKGAGAAKRALSQIAEETGGRSFFIDTADELSAIYATIQEEIRSRYLIGYQSSNTSGDKSFREVTVEASPSGLVAKTMSGYYP